MSHDMLRASVVLGRRYTNLPLPPRSTVERFYWPSERHLAPTHCGHCGAALLLGSVPTADAPLVDVDCLYCTRTACELAHDGMRGPTP